MRAFMCECVDGCECLYVCICVSANLCFCVIMKICVLETGFFCQKRMRVHVFLFLHSYGQLLFIDICCCTVLQKSSLVHPPHARMVHTHVHTRTNTHTLTLTIGMGSVDTGRNKTSWRGHFECLVAVLVANSVKLWLGGCRWRCESVECATRVQWPLCWPCKHSGQEQHCKTSAIMH